MLNVALSPEPPPSVEVVIEIPRGSFLKRGASGIVDFVSPLPCLYNYGSIHQYIGGDGDFLDAIVLGPRLSVGTKVRVNAYGAVGVSERFMYDDKLVCAMQPISPQERRNVLLFLRLYMVFKGLLNMMRGHTGRSRCEGWGEASAAIERAKRVNPAPG